MKRTSSLFLAASLAIGAVAAAQNAPVPVITSVPQRASFAPGNVVINGTNLGIATSVKINGVDFPIQRVNSARMIVGPVTPQDPGFGSIQVISNRSTASATIEFLPTLKAQRHSQRMTVTLNNGDVGTYTVRFSYAGLPAPETDAGIYGNRLLGLASPTLAVGTGIFPDKNPVTVEGILIPLQLGAIGAPMHLQAECTNTTAGVTAYTNLATISGFGNPLP